MYGDTDRLWVQYRAFHGLSWRYVPRNHSAHDSVLQLPLVFAVSHVSLLISAAKERCDGVARLFVPSAGSSFAIGTSTPVTV